MNDKTADAYGCALQHINAAIQEIQKSEPSGPIETIYTSSILESLSRALQMVSAVYQAATAKGTEG